MPGREARCRAGHGLALWGLSLEFWQSVAAAGPATMVSLSLKSFTLEE